MHLEKLFASLDAYGTTRQLDSKNRIRLETSKHCLVGRVRRVGKTCLCRTLDRVKYFDCEHPRVRRQLEDPQAFLEDLGSGRVVLNEIHRLSNPFEILKIADDHYPEVEFKSLPLLVRSFFEPDLLEGKALRP